MTAITTNEGLAVLFDLGDVLVRVCVRHAFDELASIAARGGGVGDPRAAVLEHMALTIDDFGTGKLSPETFFQRLGKALHCPLTWDEGVAAWCSMFEPCPQMEQLAGDVIAAGYPTYLLSNTDPVHFSHISARLPVLRGFRGLHLSFEVGRIKPDVGYFTSALDRFGLEAQRCVFIDDRSENVAAARSLGIRAHCHDGDASRTRAFLQRAGVLV